jgi:hypothetical protein
MHAKGADLLEQARNASKTMPTIRSHSGLMGDGGCHPEQRAFDTALPNDQKPIVWPAIPFNIFTCRDETTGEDEIYLLVDDQGYAWFEHQARRCGITVDALAYASLAEKMKPHGLKISSDSFYVTTTLPPDIDFIDIPPAIKRTLD